MSNQWLIQDKNGILNKVRKLIKVYAVNHDITIAEAIKTLVELGHNTKNS
jgi:hypothetical protein